MRIFTAVDRNYLPGLIVMARSLALSSSAEHLIVLAVDLSQAEKADAERRSWIEIQWIDVQAPEGPTPLYFNSSVYARLLGPRVIDAERLLYIDADVILNDDPMILADVDLADTRIAGVPSVNVSRISDRPSARIAGREIDPDARWMAGGIWLLRCDDEGQSLIDEALEIASIQSESSLADEEAINTAVMGHFTPLDLRWNQVSRIRDLSPERYRRLVDEFGPHQTIRAIYDPALIHFTGRLKPWHTGPSDRWSARWHHLNRINE